MTHTEEQSVVAIPIHMQRNRAVEEITAELQSHGFIPLPVSVREAQKFGSLGELTYIGYRENVYWTIRRHWIHQGEGFYPRLHLKVDPNLSPTIVIGHDNRYRILLKLSIHKDVLEHTLDITPAALKECKQKLLAIEHDNPIPERIKLRLG
jgi:hypothetical protein